MKVIHLIGGGDEGGAKSHVLQLIKELGKHIEVTLVSYRKGPFHEDAVKMGIDARVIHSGNIFLDFRRTLKIVREGGYTLIHSHGAKANMIASVLKKATGLPAVTTVHSDYKLDYMHSLAKRFSFGLINRIALRRIDYHVSVSNNFKEMLIKRGFNPQRIFSVYNGIDFENPIPPCTRTEFFRQFAIPFPEDCVLMGILARLHPVKDHETFLRAASVAAKANPKAYFLICGPGDEMKAQLQALSRELGIGDRVWFTGMVQKPFDYFQAIDINVLTSLSESFPYVILEGARFSRATVSTRVGGLADLIETGVNGYLAEPRDWKTLGSHLSELSLNKERREEMGRLLHEKAETYFSLKSMCATQLSIYNRIIRIEKNVRQDGKCYDVAILGYYGYKNSGDEAILKSILDAFRGIHPELTYVVFSKNPRETMRNFQVASVKRFNILKVARTLKHSRLFLAGGGSLIQDNTSTRSILYYLTVLRIATRMNTKTMLFSNGIGPIKRPFNRKLSARVLNALNAISLRDPISFEEIKQLGISSPHIYVTSDPAILLEPAENGQVHRLFEAEGLPEDKPLIGISIRKWWDSGYVNQIAAIADYCSEKLGAFPVFIPMQFSSDYEISQVVAKRMKRPCRVIRNIYPPEVLLGFTGRLELLIGMRLHSLIYAASQCIPMAGLVYEPKVDAFLAEINQPSAGSVEFLDVGRVTALLDDIWRNRSEIRDKLAQSKIRLSIMARKNIETAYEMLAVPDASRQEEH